MAGVDLIKRIFQYTSISCVSACLFLSSVDAEPTSSLIENLKKEQKRAFTRKVETYCFFKERAMRRYGIDEFTLDQARKILDKMKRDVRDRISLVRDPIPDKKNEIINQVLGEYGFGTAPGDKVMRSKNSLVRLLTDKKGDSDTLLMLRHVLGLEAGENILPIYLEDKAFGFVRGSGRRVKYFIEPEKGVILRNGLGEGNRERGDLRDKRISHYVNIYYMGREDILEKKLT